MRSLVSLCLYLGTGLALHVCVIGEAISWADAGSLLWIFGWPIALIFYAMKWLLIVGGALAICAAFAVLVGWLRA